MELATAWGACTNEACKTSAGESRLALQLVGKVNRVLVHRAFQRGASAKDALETPLDLRQAGFTAP